jgi:transposase-like protein
MAKKGQRFRSFSPEYKAKAVLMHLGIREVARELGLPSHDYLYRWVRAYEKNGQAGLKDHRGRNTGIHLGVISSQKPELRINRNCGLSGWKRKLRY